MKKASLLVLALLLVPVAFADVGRHPTLTITIQENNIQVSESALVCYDTFMAGYDHPKIAAQMIGISQGLYCPICAEGLCNNWFYSLPSKAYIIYPLSQEYSEYTAFENNPFDPLVGSAKLYGPVEITYRNKAEYDHNFEADLNTDGTILLRDKTEVLEGQYTSSTFSMFGIALALTLIVEFITAFIYLRLTDTQLNKSEGSKLFGFIFLANMISLPVVWYGLPLINIRPIMNLAIAEIFAILFEAFLIFYFNEDVFSEFKEALYLSLAINVISFLVGYLLLLPYRFLTIMSYAPV